MGHEAMKVFKVILISILVCWHILLFKPVEGITQDKNIDKNKTNKVLLKDQERDKATKAKPLPKSQNVHRYVRFKKDLSRDIKPGEHTTSDAKRGHPPSREKAQKMYGTPKKPKYRGTIQVEKGQPVKKNKVIGGERGRGEMTSTKPIPQKNVKKIIKLQ